MQLFLISTYNAGLIELKLLGKTLFEFAPFVNQRAHGVQGVINSCNSDVVCMQEVFSKTHAKAITKATEWKFPYQLFPRTLRPKVLGSGLGILSKYPIMHARTVFFDSQLIEERLFAPKGYMTVLIDVPEFGLVEIHNTHTTAGGSKHHPESKVSDRCREDQLLELLDFANQRDASITTTILAGDLNCGPEASRGNYETLLARGCLDANKVARGEDTAPVTWDPNNFLNISSPHKTSPAQRIDHILTFNSKASIPTFAEMIGTAATVRICDDLIVTPSDHYGVSVSLQREA